MKWVKLEGSKTEAAEVPGAGCLVRVGNAMCFAPGLRLEGSRLAASKAKPAKDGWAGNAGNELSKKLDARNSMRELNNFIIRTWNVVPTDDQLSAIWDILYA